MQHGFADGDRAGEVALNPAPIKLVQRCCGNDKRRLGGHLSPEVTATGLSNVPGRRLCSYLSLPCAADPDAPAPDRHGPLQIRRIPNERKYQTNTKSRLLEARPTLSRRYRIYHNQRHVDRDTGLYLWQVRHDLSLPSDDPFVQRHQEPGAERDLRAGFG